MKRSPRSITDNATRIIGQTLGLTILTCAAVLIVVFTIWAAKAMIG